MTTTSPRGEVAVREATRADLLSVFRIEKRSFDQPWPYAAFERFLGDPGFLVAERDDRVVGYAVADSVPNRGAPMGHLKDLAVDPEHRGEGIGRLVLSEALSRLFVDGVARVKLEVRRGNHAARSLYESFGFELHHVSPGYYDDGEDALVMVRQA
ncbi:ribosomal protein S18-alanine N-acetyltransferase [Natronomonas amylolytica]|uniref:ribosomal protein S18-alanine N-acetyltransferase n=1 Tax=Natronomonas amylolytica TaxID=3108498 RepID=UPI00300A1373